MQKVWKYIKKHKIVNLLNFILLLILSVPFSYSYGNNRETEKLHWISNYMYNELDLIVFYLPILALTIGFQIATKKVWKNALLTLNLGIAVIYFLETLFSLIVPIQDHSFGLGQLLILTLFPLITFIYRFEQF